MNIGLPKLTTSDKWQGILVGIGVIASCFVPEIRELIISIMGKWQIILFVFSVVGLFFLILKIWLRERINKRFEDLENLNKNLVDSIQWDRDFQTVGYRMMRDIIIPSMAYNTQENKEIFASELLRLRFDKKQLERFGIPQDIIDIFLVKFHEQEKGKIEQGLDHNGNKRN